MTRVLGGALGRAGHRVTVVTNQKGDRENHCDLQLVRRPGMMRLVRAYEEAEAVILQGPAARLGWPLFWKRRPGVVVHHTLCRNGRNAASAWIRTRLFSRVRHAAVSKGLAKNLQWPIHAILPNPYDDHVFRENPNILRTRDILFVGRLIPEKGAHILIQALAQLAPAAGKVTATLVGTGPDHDRLAQSISGHGLNGRVRMTGPLSGNALAQMYQQHRILAVPSVRPEAFGLVALEAIACGCVVVGTGLGGLPEAIGPCGVTLRSTDVSSLAHSLLDLLRAPDRIAKLQAGAGEHLAKHRPAIVAEAYMDFLRVAIARLPPSPAPHHSPHLRVSA